MKRVAIALAAGLFGFAAAVASACDYVDKATMASTTEQMGLAPTPEASKAPATTVVKTTEPKVVKQVNAKVKASTSDGKVAAVTTN